MAESALIGIVSIFVFGIGAQWLAWQTKLPGILLLLLAGIVAGPVTGLVNPDTLMGDLLGPFISVSVGIILFEGGLSLNFKELKEVGGVITKLVSIGVVVTLATTAVAAYYLFDMSIELAILLGAMLVVTGPTVIIPLLRQVRPTGQVSNVLKWEGIVIDPIGAMLAVLVFEAIISSSYSTLTGLAFMSILKTIVFGTVLGLAGAGIIYFLLSRYLLPDYLENPVNLMIVVVIFGASNFLQHESGLWATTVMGIALANQKSVRIHHIVEFKENLRILLLSALFILLAARVDLSELLDVLDWKMAAFLAILIVLARPLSVYVSTIGSSLNWKEKLFVSWMAPRGVVAASIASLFALQLSLNGYEEAEILVPIVFTVIISTVAIYGLSANWVARKLGVSKQSPDGCLIIGAHNWARELALILKGQNIKILLADTNRGNIRKARKMGIKCYHGNMLAEHALDEIDLEGIGKLISLTHNDEVNSLAVIRFKQLFSSAGVFQLSPYTHNSTEQEVPENLSGRILFHKELHFDEISEIWNKGGGFKLVELADELTLEEFKQKEFNPYLPLFHFTKQKKGIPYTHDLSLAPKIGDKVLCLVIPKGYSFTDEDEDETDDTNDITDHIV